MRRQPAIGAREVAYQPNGSTISEQLGAARLAGSRRVNIDKCGQPSELASSSELLLAPCRREQLELQHRQAIRHFLGLPRQSPVAASLAEAGSWPLSLTMLRQSLNHVDRLHRAPGGSALLQRLRNRPASRMGRICALYEEMVPQPPIRVQPLPPLQQPLDVHLELDKLSKRRTPACELQQAAMEKIHEKSNQDLQSLLDICQTEVASLGLRFNTRNQRLSVWQEGTRIQLR
ncbi:hypothetical protein HPB52_018309 [Rhipicephalus sanguineus]|uniref:Uncharacterized protein n=1 Tax=Rhipicephalus sanguineus TaxID=34632 RepID=A0A9D4QF63_RHISA|nr:hypothetical protein HPB52_018309 [Rhipicephalus sanguineus]